MIENQNKRNRRDLYAPMADRNTSVKTVEVLEFVITAGKNTPVKNAKGVRFASMAGKNQNV